jgi:hypothetical protein
VVGAGGNDVVARAAGAGGSGGALLGIAFQVININSGRCLTVVGAAMADNAKLIQRTCAAEPAFRWRFVPVTFTGGFLIQNVKSGKCLAVAGAGRENNDFAVQTSCDTAPARQWQLRRSPGVPATLPNSDAQLANAHSGKCLTIAGGGVAENGVAVQYVCDRERSRRWTVRLIAGPLLTSGEPAAVTTG